MVIYDLDIETRALLEEIVAFYGRMRAGDLVELSHVLGGPWHEAWNHGGKINPGMRIEDSCITEFYSKVRCPFSIQ